MTHGSAGGVTFQLGNTTPPSVFIKSSTGVTFAAFATPGRVAFDVQAVDEGGASMTYASYAFDVVAPPVFATVAGWDPKAEAAKAGLRHTYVAGAANCHKTINQTCVVLGVVSLCHLPPTYDAPPHGGPQYARRSERKTA